MKGAMVEDVIDEELFLLLVDPVDEGAGRDANDSLMDDIEEWAWFRKPFGASFNGTGSVGGASIRSEAFI